MLIKRFFRDEYMPQLVRDFGFLVQTIKDYVGEFELSFREDTSTCIVDIQALPKRNCENCRSNIPIFRSRNSFIRYERSTARSRGKTRAHRKCDAMNRPRVCK